MNTQHRSQLRIRADHAFPYDMKIESVQLLKLLDHCKKLYQDIAAVKRENKKLRAKLIKVNTIIGDLK